MVAAVALAVHLPALGGGFVFDDVDNVIRNPWVRDPGRLGEAFTHHMAAFLPGASTSYYRPFLHVLLAGAHAVSGLDPRGYHLLLVLLHALACLGVLALLVRMVAVDDPGASPAARATAAGVGAVLFAVHPVHVEAVAWVSGVVDLSASLLSVGTLLALTSRRAGVRIGLGPLAFLLALLAKEPAVTILPAWLAFAIASGEASDRARRRTFVAAAAGMAAALVLYLALRVAALGGLMAGGANRVAVGPVDGLLTALSLAGRYAGLLLVPAPLTIVHDARVVKTLADPWVWVGAASALALGWAVGRARRRPARLLGLSLLVLPLLPALWVPVLGEGLVGERYLYLPSVGLALLVALSWNALRLPGRTPAVRAAAGAVAILLAVAGAGIGLARIRAWRDDRALWSSAVRASPGSAAAHEGLGFALLSAGDPAGAAQSLERAIRLDPGRCDARTNLASALLALGRTDEAMEQARAVLAASPRRAEAHAVLARALLDRGDVAAARDAYARAVEIDPRVAAFHNGLAIAAARTGDLATAELHFREALRLDPGRQDYARNLEALLRMRGGRGP